MTETEKLLAEKEKQLAALKKKYAEMIARQKVEHPNWGGKRPGAGRKKTTRKKRSIYVSDDEYTLISTFTKTLKLSEKQRNKEEWKDGNITAFFFKDGLPCLRFKSGKFWHYDLEKDTWF